MKPAALALITALLLTACSGQPGTPTNPTDSIPATAPTAATSTTIGTIRTDLPDLPDLTGKTVAEAVALAKAARYPSADIELTDGTAAESATAIQNHRITNAALTSGMNTLTTADTSGSRITVPPSALTYRIHGATTTFITYTTAEGTTDAPNATLPWGKTLDHTPQFATVIATDTSRDTRGVVTCTL